MLFWMGFATAIFAYFVVGVGVGIYIVSTNLARFHGAGFQYRRMAGYVAMIAAFWPGAVLEFIEAR